MAHPQTAPAVAAASITSSDTFLARAQRSEEFRVILWAATLVSLLGLAVVRRMSGGTVMWTDHVFWPTIATLLVAVAVQGALWNFLHRANRSLHLLPSWVARASAWFDLLTPMALMIIIAHFSPRGPALAATAPSLLLLPLVVLLSILRMRPILTLALGLAAAAFHFLLVLRAILLTDLPAEQQPVYLSYGVLLILLAVAGYFVASQVKAHVIAAVSEVVAREQSEQQLALVQRDLSIARDIQKGLLPIKPPTFPGFVIAGMSRPADLTGGDFYDWQLLPDGRLITVLADVTGHGIGPALVMAVCRAYTRASAGLISNSTPLLRRVNELLQADMPDDRFITLAVAVLDETGKVELLSAGHGPTLFYQSATGKFTAFESDGLPLGIDRDEPYTPPAFFDMQPGDILLLLTDGFFEYQRSNSDEAFGIERLQQTLAAHADREPEAILAALDAAVKSFADGATQKDDMTAVVIKRAVM